jgi:hypothetical protein
VKQIVTLTPDRPSTAVNLNNFQAVAVFVENPTGTSVLIRLGGNDIPTESSADHRVPANGYLLIPAEGASFAVALADPAAVSSPVSSNLLTTATVVFLDKHEALPSFGAASFQSLSTSSLEPVTAFSGAFVGDTYDLGAWGGALVFISPDAASGQAEATISVSNDGTTFYPLGTYAVWPNVPALITVPRVARYFRLAVAATSFVVEPAIAGVYSVRATISEIQATNYNPSGDAIVKTTSLVGIQSEQFSFATSGLPAVSVALISTVGSTATAAADFFVEASSDAVNWRLVTSRTQLFSQGISRYLALGPLDKYIRVTVSQLTVGQTLNASLYLSVPAEQDVAAILNTIQQSLGDADAPSNTNQDIYHELDSIRTESDETNAWLGGVDGIRDRIGDTNTWLGAPGGVISNLEAANTELDSIDDRLDFIGQKAAGIESWTFTTNSSVTSSNTKLDTIAAEAASIDTNALGIKLNTDGDTITCTILTVVATGAVQNAGSIPANSRLLGFVISGTVAGTFQIRIGTGGVVGPFVFYSLILANTPVSMQFQWRSYIDVGANSVVWLIAPAGSTVLLSLYTHS